jgi:UDP-N-acetylmuramoylalanine--D-glutamate ligase
MRRVVAALPGLPGPLELFRAHDLPLPGDHNLLNAMAAAVAAVRHGADPEVIPRALQEFRGLPHRLQPVARVSGVRFFDDSKATNVESALAALRSFDDGVVLIAGGKHKGSSYAPLRAEVVGRCRAVVLIGEAADHLAVELEGAASIHRAGDLDEATEAAWELARPDGTVLLAPACSSFDMFRDFNHRGEVFQTAVERIVTREAGTG